MNTIGVLCALGALVSWGVGDFLIQRSARKFGDTIALFFITAFGAFILLPFVWNEIIATVSSPNSLLILLITSGIILFAALFDFEALRIGKISVIEPVYAFEVLITTTLASIVIQEKPNLFQFILIAGLLIGIFLVSTKSFHHLRSIHLEKGVLQAILATIGMGFVNFLFGVGARETNPLMINWFTSLFLAIVMLGYILFRSKWREVIGDWEKNKELITSVSFFDNLAWIFYAYGTTYIPIAITTTISEGYIAFAAALGLVFNKEKLQFHQYLGMVLAIGSVIVLSAIT
jgi:drug/metabolite transporter (DMT)-like permease